jgi:hypothetical protein
MSQVVKTAGLQAALASVGPSAQEKAPTSPRRQRVQLIRQVLRKQDASDDEMDDALEALIELSKDD